MKSILNFSEAAVLGLHTMALLANHPGDRISTVQITEVLGCSGNTLSKVMQRLSHADLLVSVRGPSGGFSLARDPAEVSILEIYEAIDGRISDLSCLLGNHSCKFSTCILGTLHGDVSRLVRETLSGNDLATLARSMPLRISRRNL